MRVFALRRLMEDRFPWADVTMPGAVERTVYRATRWCPSFVRWARSLRLMHAHLGQTAPFAMMGAACAGVPYVVSYYGHDVVMYRTRERFQSFAWWYALLRQRTFARELA